MDVQSIRKEVVGIAWVAGGIGYNVFSYRIIISGQGGVRGSEGFMCDVDYWGVLILGVCLY